MLADSTLEDADFDKSTEAATHAGLDAAAAELLPTLSAVRPVQR